jgi:hypothetical protein
MNEKTIEIGDFVVGARPEDSRGIVFKITKILGESIAYVYWFKSTRGYPFEEKNSTVSLKRCLKRAREDGYII